MVNIGILVDQKEIIVIHCYMFLQFLFIQTVPAAWLS